MLLKHWNIDVLLSCRPLLSCSTFTSSSSTTLMMSVQSRPVMSAETQQTLLTCSPTPQQHSDSQYHCIGPHHGLGLCFISVISISSNVSEDIIEDEDRKWCMTQPHWPSCFVFYQLYSWSKYFQRGPSTGPQKASKLLLDKRYAVDIFCNL